MKRSNRFFCLCTAPMIKTHTICAYRGSTIHAGPIAYISLYISASHITGTPRLFYS